MKNKPEPDSDLILYPTEDGRTRLPGLLAESLPPCQRHVRRKPRVKRGTGATLGTGGKMETAPTGRTEEFVFRWVATLRRFRAPRWGAGCFGNLFPGLHPTAIDLRKTWCQKTTFLTFRW